MVANRIGAATNRENIPQSTTLPVQAEVRAPTTTTTKEQPHEAIFRYQAPARTLHKKATTWCAIHKTTEHSLKDCKIVQRVKACTEEYGRRDGRRVFAN
uniref:Uncharacterized protein n=1 Tax=Leersia perrieri TaxID=77586 RepID=A0A0D9X3K0_9ORYZ